MAYPWSILVCAALLICIALLLLVLRRSDSKADRRAIRNVRRGVAIGLIVIALSAIPVFLFDRLPTSSPQQHTVERAEHNSDTWLQKDLDGTVVLSVSAQGEIAIEQRTEIVNVRSPLAVFWWCFSSLFCVVLFIFSLTCSDIIPSDAAPSFSFLTRVLVVYMLTSLVAFAFLPTASLPTKEIKFGESVRAYSLASRANDSLLLMNRTENEMRAAYRHPDMIYLQIDSTGRVTGSAIVDRPVNSPEYDS